MNRVFDILLVYQKLFQIKALVKGLNLYLCGEMYRLSLVILMFLCNTILFAQKKSFDAVRVSETIETDGKLNELIWEKEMKDQVFVKNYPSFGEPASEKIELSVLYDNQNLYIAAKLYDKSPDSISYALSERDDFGNGDWFGVLIDPYQNSNSAFGFYNTAAGVQIDEIKYNESTSRSWNAVWKSKTSKFDKGWIAEFKIPFSAIRFPKDSIHNWNINFVRQIRRRREESSWSAIDPEKFGTLTQMGVLEQVKNVKVPVRLSFTPYLAGSAIHYDDKDGTTKDWSFGYGGGVDVKYGITESFTLDVTLVPDFSQVRSDNQVLNLSAFEVKFTENRPFFTEGTELFSIGDLFYSRRLGDQPDSYNAVYGEVNESIGEFVKENPSKSKLINATKLSGRTNKGLGIAFFNGIEGRSYGVISDSTGEQTRRVKTNALTNYNVLVLSQNLPNASKVSFVNTNTWREGNYRDANVSLLKFEFRNKEKSYGIISDIGVSYIHENENHTVGHKAALSIAKLSGNWRFQLAYNESSDTYDQNDLGFLNRNNYRNISSFIEYKRFRPWKNVLRFSTILNIEHQRLYLPNLFNYLLLEANTFLTYKNFLWFGTELSYEPIGSHDYYEPRSWGKYHRNPSKFAFGGFLSSDYSKRFAIDVDAEVIFYGEDQRTAVNFAIEPRIRISDRWFFTYSFNFDYNPKERGVVLDNGALMFEENQIIYSKRNRRTIENEISTQFIFTPTMGVNFRMRHYWSTVYIDSYHQLQEDGLLGFASYNGEDFNGVRLHDQNYNAFTIDFVYSWIFAPGSELNFTWKHSIFSSDSNFEENYFRNTGAMFDEPITNSLSIKILYYLDVLYFKKKKKKAL